MASLNLDLDYFDHPKTKRLVGLLGKGSDVLPIRLWCYAGKFHAKDGRLTGYSAQEIESLVGWWGKQGQAIDAMAKVGFGDWDGTTFSIHDWDRHAGHIETFKERARAAAVVKWERLRSATSMLQASNEHACSNASAVQGSARQGSPPPANESPPENPVVPDVLVVGVRDYLTKHPRLPVWTQQHQDQLCWIVKEKGWPYTEKAIDGALNDGRGDPIRHIYERLKRQAKTSGNRVRSAVAAAGREDN